MADHKLAVPPDLEAHLGGRVACLGQQSQQRLEPCDQGPVLGLVVGPPAKPKTGRRVGAPTAPVQSSKTNGTKQTMYCSTAPARWVPLLADRLRFGRGTNNEAEYRSLIAGLELLLALLTEAGNAAAEVRLEVRGDSQLVIRQLEGSGKAKEPRMRRLRDRALNLLRRFASVRLTDQDRSRSLAVLGH